MNNCHAKPMWYACNPCCKRADFKKKKKEKKKEKGSKDGEKKYQPSNIFKIVLSAMLSDKDFKMLEAQSRWQQIDITGWIIFTYMGTKDLIGQFGHGQTDKPKEKTQKKVRLEEMRTQINILSSLRVKYLKVLLGKEMVLSSYMMSSSYCGYWKRK
eukprot:13450350-Ditylum_brightwellii.AAC.1